MKPQPLFSLLLMVGRVLTLDDSRAYDDSGTLFGVEDNELLDARERREDEADAREGREGEVEAEVEGDEL